ncbi:6-phospho-beta-glucosidase [Terriglobus roseus]|uniref:6-phospho-beta-glucosidase n=1 Tax=Terriglobus roseus TaxID=392734 RepID=A0A1H4JAL1_9BACT|nr:6-phospho-beta-glucosidase [Terriglobus roseus]SEB43197.1 6-phospho-beta-glucosidase [Terriglobus roseus]
MPRKIAFLGGGGVRTPLVAFGINESATSLQAEELVLYDLDPERAQMTARLSREVVRRDGGSLRIRVAATPEEAIDGASFVLNSVRVGGTGTRAHDERAAIACGYPGQETTGPGGIAMGQRTIPIAIAQARLVERVAPQAWIVNFTNPAGLITQAIMQNSNAKVVGICDTPTEMLHRIAIALDATQDEVVCDYIGLNHLGWVRRVMLRGEDVTHRILNDDAILLQLYSAPLFEPDLIRALGLIPTEYLFFYYSRTRALENQRRQGATRGEQIGQMNEALAEKLLKLHAGGDDAGALQAYIDYLNLRSGSYMKLEGQGSSAFDDDAPQEDPFRAASGYHRIALQVMNALVSDDTSRIIVNTRNADTIPEIAADDVIEAMSVVGKGLISPLPVGPLPEAVRGLVLAVKAYERTAIDAVISGSERELRKAMLLYPAIGEWDPSATLLKTLKWK